MSPAYAPIPLPNRSSSSSNRAAGRPAFNAPLRWTLIVLSWLAFGIAGYLAYASVTGASVAGCGVGAANGCDVVLSSSWSKLLGVPVAVLGLACYSALASLSLLLGWRNAEANRWITTAFVMLAIVAAGASLWFIGVQKFAIGDYCKYCLVTDACGILIGIFAVAAAAQCLLARRASPQARTLQPGLMALRAATTPTAPRNSPAAVTPIPSSPPSLLAALGGAVPLLLLLVGGQLLFAGKTFHEEEVALSNTIQLDDSAGSVAATDSSAATPHVALRVPDPLEGSDVPPTNDDAAKPNPDEHGDELQPDQVAASADSDVGRADEIETAAAPPPEPSRERVVKLLGGKLTLNAYQHPIIGSPEAPHIAVEMVSYDCPHCRKMHAIMQKALERYGDQVALLVLPYPLDKDCNEVLKKMIAERRAVEAASHRGACGTARLACGIAKIDPRRFARFHDFLMSGDDKPPPMERIIPKAYGIVNRDRLREISRGPEVKKQIEGYIDLFAQLEAKHRGSKTFGLPVQILGDKVISGSVEKPEDVYKAWEENLGVKPK